MTDNGVQDMIQTMPESLQGFILNLESTDGKIIFAPSAADGVGAFDHADESFQLIDISAQVSNYYNFGGAAPAANGKIIFAPYVADGVGIFDPDDERFRLIDHSALLSSDYKSGGAAPAAKLRLEQSLSKVGRIVLCARPR